MPRSQNHELHGLWPLAAGLFFPPPKAKGAAASPSNFRGNAALALDMLLVYLLFRLFFVASDASATTLTWNMNHDAATVGYALYLGQQSGLYLSRIDVGNVSSYNLPVLPQGGTYYFALTAYSESHAESGYSNEVRVAVPYDPPVTSFVASTSSTSAPVAMNFVSDSSGLITSYAWNFGDGATSTAPSPTHVYAVPGVFAVTLTVTGPGGTSTQMGRVTTTSLSSQTSSRKTGMGAPLPVR